MAPIPKNLYGDWIKQEIVTGSFWRDAVAEFLATFFFVSSQIALTVTAQSATVTPALFVALGSAAVWMALGYIMTDYGAANMNPAVTLSLIIRAEITIIRGMLYWVFQIIGAILGAYFIYSLTPDSPEDNFASLVNNYPSTAIEDWQAFLVELWITTMLCLVVLSTRANRNRRFLLPSLPSALALAAGILIAFHTTGGSMNPARSIAPLVTLSSMDEDVQWGKQWVYWAGPMGGGIVAAIIFWLLETATNVDNPLLRHKEQTWDRRVQEESNPNAPVYTVNRTRRQRHTEPDGFNNNSQMNFMDFY